MSTIHEGRAKQSLATPPVGESATRVATIAAAAIRLSIGWVFLWAFLDKAFGLHYSTGAPVAEGAPALAWINGGTPSQGFMKFAAIGPLKDAFASAAGVWTDWLFMLCLLGVGVAVMLGVGLRISAVAGSLLMLLMWAAEWPLIQGSNNPLVDYHIIYALVLVVCAVLLAGDTFDTETPTPAVLRQLQ